MYFHVPIVCLRVMTRTHTAVLALGLPLTSKLELWPPNTKQQH